jgi:hypothetical protein
VVNAFQDETTAVRAQLERVDQHHALHEQH